MSSRFYFAFLFSPIKFLISDGSYRLKSEDISTVVAWDNASVMMLNNFSATISKSTMDGISLARFTNRSMALV